MARVFIPLANGTEEMEAIITVDMLRRAGFHVVLASVEPTLQVVASRKVQLVADTHWQTPKPSDWDALVIPGGGAGVAAFRKHEGLLNAIREFHALGKWVAAICAGPLVLHDAGILGEKKYTCYPGCEREITEGVHQFSPVVQDGNILTSQGAGTAFAFALALADLLSKETPLLSERLASDICLR